MEKFSLVATHTAVKRELCMCISDLYNEWNFVKKVSFDFESLAVRQANQL